MFAENEALWQRKIDDHKRTADRTLTLEDLNNLTEQRKKDEAYAQSEKEKAKREAEIKEWDTLQQNLKLLQGYVDDYRGKVQQWETSANAIQAQLEKMLADGFVIPAPAPKAVPKSTLTPLAQKAEPAPEPEPSRKEFQPCPICGEKVPPGIAFHRLPDSDGMICCIDAKRTKLAGIRPEAIEEALQRQAQAMLNAAEQKAA